MDIQGKSCVAFENLYNYFFQILATQFGSYDMDVMQKALTGLCKSKLSKWCLYNLSPQYQIGSLNLKKDLLNRLK